MAQKITRVEIVDYTQEVPRTVVISHDDNKKAIYEVQDDGRTLKIFIEEV